MNLLDIRKQFVKISGRYDMVVDAVDFADNGANFYINEGQKSLERRIDFSPANAKFYRDLTVGEYLIQLAGCRVVKEVWVLDTDSRTQLEELSEGDLKEFSETLPLSSATRSKPTHYYNVGLRRSPDDEDGAGDSSIIQSFIDTLSPSNPAYTGVVIWPPADSTYGIEVSGLFYNTVLTDNTDENYWSVRYPMLLIMSALYHLEIMYKGSKSSSAWHALIEAELLNIEFDSVDQESYNVHQTRG